MIKDLEPINANPQKIIKVGLHSINIYLKKSLKTYIYIEIYIEIYLENEYLLFQLEKKCNIKRGH